MAVTIYDVAKRAGVGIGTVSRAINNHPQISPQTKAVVLQTIRELHYQPHAMAQGLARKKTNSIAVIVPFFTGYFFIELLRGIQQEISKDKYNMILYSVDRTNKTEMFLKKTLQERRVDGVLLISLQISSRYAGLFKQSKLPIVLVDSHHPSLDSITVQNEQGAFIATQHLIQLGHTRIGMIDGQLKSSPAQVRLKGFKRALREYGIHFNPKYLVISDFITGADGFNREAGYQAMKRFLDMGKNRPSAVFISSDIQAAGAIKAVHESELSIPNDIAIVGFDDIELAEYLELTTMRQPMFEMGKLAVQRLMDRIAEPDSDVFLKNFSTTLVIRNSSGTALGSAGGRP
jgi:LacI family transcriptional regulator